MKETKKRFIREIIISLMIAFAMVIGMYMYYFYEIKPKLFETTSYNDVGAENEELLDLEKLKDKTVISQKIVGCRNEIAGFSLLLHKDSQLPINEKMKIQFLAEGKVLQSWDLNMNGVTDGQVMDFKLENPLIGTWNKVYEIKITTKNLQESGVYVNEQRELVQKGLIVDDEVIKGSIVTALLNHNLFLKKLYIIFCGIVFLGVIFIRRLKWKKETKIENYFLQMGIVLGIMFILLIPPGVSPDDLAHIATSYSDVNKIMGKEAIDKDGYTIARETDIAVGISNQLSLNTMAKYKDQLIKKPEFVRTQYIRGPLKTPIIAHLPQDIGVLLGWIFHQNGMITLYMGKICALIFYLICIYCAIRWLPWGKQVLAIIALFPINLELATSFSYDCIVLSLSFLLTAYVMKLIYEKEWVEWKDYLILTIISICLSPCKVAYVFMMGLVFAIPKEKHKVKVKPWICKCGVVLLGVVAVMVTRLSLVTNIVSGEGSVEAYTLREILNPAIWPRTLHYTYFQERDRYFGDFFGNSLGYYQIQISWILIGALLVVLVLALCSQENVQKVEKKTKWLVLGLALIMTGGIFVSLWLDFTPKTIYYIAGVQSRYFMPYIPILLLLFCKGNFSVKKPIYHQLFQIQYIVTILIGLDIWKYLIG